MEGRIGSLIISIFSSVQFSRSVMSDFLWPMDLSMPGFPICHQLPELTQTHIHWVSRLGTWGSEKLCERLVQVSKLYNRVFFIFVVVQLLSNGQLFVTHGLQNDRLPCPSLSTRVDSNLCPLSQWCYLTISSSVAPFSYCLQSFLTSGSFPVNQLSASGGQSTRASASA